MGTAEYRSQRTTIDVDKRVAARFRLAKVQLSGRAGRILTTDDTLSGLLDLLDAHLAGQLAPIRKAG